MKVIERTNEEDMLIANLDFERYTETLNEIEIRVIILLSEGYNQQEIAQKMRMSQPSISRIINTMRRGWLEYSKFDEEKNYEV
jgi:DNA-binding MarR family transcriptional regulator